MSEYRVYHVVYNSDVEPSLIYSMIVLVNSASIFNRKRDSQAPRPSIDRTSKGIQLQPWPFSAWRRVRGRVQLPCRRQWPPRSLNHRGIACCTDTAWCESTT